MAKILLIGCGSLGRKLARQLIKEGHTVIGVKRSPLREPVAGMDVVLADITCQAAVKKIPTDVDQVVVLLAPAERNKEAYQRLYQQGLNNALTHFVNVAHNAHWLFISSTSVYAQRAGEWVDEDSPVQGTSFNGRALIRAEKNLWAQCASNTVVRFSGIYGRGRENLVDRVRAGLPIQYDPPYYTNRIHEEDCIGVLCFLIKKRLASEPIQSLYLASDSSPAPFGEVVLWLSKSIGCRRPPENVDIRRAKTANKRCDNNRLLSLGYSLLYPNYQEGYAQFLDSVG